MIKFDKVDLFLVSGASSGIGRAISLRIIELGGSVIGAARNRERLRQTKEMASDTGAFNIEVKDLTEDIDRLPEWLKHIVERHGKLKGMALAAGIQHTLPVQAEKVEKSKKLFDINFFSNLALIKGFSKKSNNCGSESSIVVISSFTSLIGVPGTVSYSASKGALNSSVKTLAIELARDGLRINAVLPGHIITEMFSGGSQQISKKFIESLEPKYPLGLGKPADVANAVCFLLSDAARWITGTNLIIDGGASINF